MRNSEGQVRDKIVKALRQQQIRHEDAAEAIGMSRQTFSGKLRLADVPDDFIEAIEDYLGIKFDFSDIRNSTPDINELLLKTVQEVGALKERVGTLEKKMSRRK